MEKARERVPAFEHVVHRLAHIAVTRQLATLRSHPLLQLRHQRGNARTAYCNTLVGRAAADLALDVKERGAAPRAVIVPTRLSAELSERARLANSSMCGSARHSATFLSA